MTGRTRRRHRVHESVGDAEARSGERGHYKHQIKSDEWRGRGTNGGLGSTPRGCDGGMIEVKVVGAFISAN
jgi:hypothetical protein